MGRTSISLRVTLREQRWQDSVLLPQASIWSEIALRGMSSSQYLQITNSSVQSSYTHTYTHTSNTSISNLMASSAVQCTKGKGDSWGLPHSLCVFHCLLAWWVVHTASKVQRCAAQSSAQTKLIVLLTHYIPRNTDNNEHISLHGHQIYHWQYPLDCNKTWSNSNNWR